MAKATRNTFFYFTIFATVFLKSIIAELTFVEQDGIIEAGPIVTLPDGQILGLQESTVDQGTTYFSFKGIPYAQPPVGDLRFKEPQKNANWAGTLDATKDRSMCIQQTSPVQGSEDCLYINVYTPDLTGNLAVMVWIFGGSFNTGTASYSQYGPDYLVEQGVVYVSLNYRLGVLGFLNTGDLASPGNWGLKDQIFALQWVQENIHLFGGNPNQVTIFGESAGSASVSYLVQSSRTEGLFHGAIMESGHSLNLWAYGRKGSQAATIIGQRLGISTSNTADLVNKLRQVEMSRLNAAAIEAHSELNSENILNGLIFAPEIEPEHENAVLSDKNYKLLAEGNFQRVPCIVGFNSNEVAAFSVLFSIIRSFYALNYDYNRHVLAPADLTDDEASRTAAATKIKEHFVPLLPFSLATDAQICQMYGADQYYRGIREGVMQQSKYSDVYLYQFSYFGYLGFQGSRVMDGVGHGEELPYLFRTYVNEYLISESDRLTRSRMTKLWTNFAKYGNPTPTADELLGNVIWGLAGTDRDNIHFLNIDKTLKMDLNPKEADMKFYDSIYDQYGNGDYDTY